MSVFLWARYPCTSLKRIRIPPGPYSRRFLLGGVASSPPSNFPGSNRNSLSTAASTSLALLQVPRVVNLLGIQPRVKSPRSSYTGLNSQQPRRRWGSSSAGLAARLQHLHLLMPPSSQRVREANAFSRVENTMAPMTPTRHRRSTYTEHLLRSHRRATPKVWRQTEWAKRKSSLLTTAWSESTLSS